MDLRHEHVEGLAVFVSPQRRARFRASLADVRLRRKLLDDLDHFKDRLDSGTPNFIGRIGTGVILHSFATFVVEGRGTPAPIAPTERLVVGGMYRHVRNPMYVAVGATIVGQALLLERLVLLAYEALLWLVVATFVRCYEEPTLSARYGESYAEYRSAVPGWWPRLRAWSPPRPPKMPARTGD